VVSWLPTHTPADQTFPILFVFRIGFFVLSAIYHPCLLFSVLLMLACCYSCAPIMHAGADKQTHGVTAAHGNQILYVADTNLRI